jgi:hypothetical protein
MPDPAYIARLFQIESGGNPNAVTGSNRGLGQFGPQEEARYGLNDANRADAAAQAAAVQREAAEHAAVLQKALGRPPTPGELYLTHQQGIAGGPALLSADPAMPAWQAIRPFYKSDRMARLAITGNVPGNHPLRGADPDAITAADFRNLWVNKFERAGGGAPARVTVAPNASSAAPAASPSAPLSLVPGGAPPTPDAPAVDPAILAALQGIASQANQSTMPAPQPMALNFPTPPGLARARAMARAMAAQPIG